MNPNWFVRGVVVTCILAMAAPSWADCDDSQPDQTPLSRYVISGAEVLDTVTGLTWRRCSVGQVWSEGTGCGGAIEIMGWQDAMHRADGAWRVPTRSELATLAAPTCNNPAINQQAFPGMEAKKPYYWSSTADGKYPWFVDFKVGGTHFTFNYDIANKAAVRLVKGGR